MPIIIDSTNGISGDPHLLRDDSPILDTLVRTNDPALSNNAKTNTKNVFTAQQAPLSGSLVDGATVYWNGDVQGQVASLTLAGNRTMAAPTNIVQNALYILRVSQDATGSRTLTWNAAFKFGGNGAPTLTTTANKVDILSFIGGASNTLEYIGGRTNAV